MVQGKRQCHAAEGHGKSPYNTRENMRNVIELVSGDLRATIKTASIDCVMAEGGGTTVFFDGAWVVTRQSYDEVMAIINKAEEAKGWRLKR